MDEPAFQGGWAATYSRKSAQNIQPFVPGEWAFGLNTTPQRVLVVENDIEK
jgi:hypothetical protein